MSKKLSQSSLEFAGLEREQKIINVRSDDLRIGEMDVMSPFHFNHSEIFACASENFIELAMGFRILEVIISGDDM